MATVTTNDLRVTNAKNLVAYLQNPDHPSYMFIGRALPWDADIQKPFVSRVEAGDNSPPIPENNNKDFYRTWDQMLGMTLIDSDEIYHCIPRINWTSGVTYDIYRHDYSENNKSFTNSGNLYNCIYYVLASNNNVYVCLDNAENSVSTVEPLAETNEPFYTTDGYQWLRLYEIDFTTLRENASNNLIPIVDNQTNKLESGGVYTVVITSAGDDYLKTPTGTLDSLPYYYCRILGDGSGAVARVTVAGGNIVTTRVVRPGKGYTYATLDFVANRVYDSLADLDNNENGLNPGGDGSFRSTVIISPPGGWGTDLVRELGAVRVAVFSTFKYNISDFIVLSNFRQVGIMSDVSYSQDPTPNTLSMVYAVKVKELTGSKNKNYKLYETVYQMRADETDPTIKHIAYGSVVGWDSSKNILRITQDPRLHGDENGVLHRFEGGEGIIGLESEKETSPDTTFGGRTPNLQLSVFLDGLEFVGGYAQPEADKYSGSLTYVTNISPVRRSTSQSERVSLVVTY